MQTYFFNVTFLNKITGQLKTAVFDEIKADSENAAYISVLELAFKALEICQNKDFTVYQITNKTK